MILAQELLPLLDTFLKTPSLYKTLLKDTYKPDTYKYISGVPNYRVMIPHGMQVDKSAMVLVTEQEEFDYTIEEFKEKIKDSSITVDYKFGCTIIDATSASAMTLKMFDCILLSSLMAMKENVLATNYYVEIFKPLWEKTGRAASFTKVKKSRFGSYQPIIEDLGSTDEEIESNLEKLSKNDFVTRDEMIVEILAHEMKNHSYVKKINRELNKPSLWQQFKRLFS